MKEHTMFASEFAAAFLRELGLELLRYSVVTQENPECGLGFSPNRTIVLPDRAYLVFQVHYQQLDSNAKSALTDPPRLVQWLNEIGVAIDYTDDSGPLAVRCEVSLKGENNNLLCFTEVEE